jgi:hypothetical protein
MSDKKTEQPLKGDAAYRAQKKAISDRNEAAYGRGRAEREASNEAALAKRRALDKRDMADLPTQPSPD